ncbi:MAG: hypothetical protein NVS9B15_16060 [Acidobacteriaceae bacterium]
MMLSRTDPTQDTRVLIFAPTGQDGPLVVRVLQRANIHADCCASFDTVFQEMQSGAGAVIIAEEGLTPNALERLAQFSSRQPSWSDFPLIFLTKSGNVTALQRRIEQTEQHLGNVLLLERPIRPETLVSSLSGVLRSRRRQYQVRDYLEQKRRAEQALRESEQQFRDLANTIPQLAWIARPDGHIFWYNQRWYEYTGTTASQMEGWGWRSVHDPEMLPKVLEKWKRSIERSESFEMTFPLRGADGKFRPFLTLVQPVLDSSGKVARWFGTNTDVSSQKRAEEALIRTEKLAAAGRLAASISHEINNPLEAVTNILYIIQTSPELDDQNRGLLQKAQAELGRVSHITTHTLRFYRESSKAAPIKLSELVDSVIALYQGRLTQGAIKVKRSYRDTEYTGFSGELRQVIANLIGNALDATPRGGTVYVRVRPTNWSGGPGVRITVADTGHGISSETLKHIFEPFFTTKESTGTGLGLFVSKEIVEKSGGKLRVRSSTEKGAEGTVFTIFLPSRRAEKQLRSA